MTDRINHAAEAREAIAEGRKSATKARVAAHEGSTAQADAHGKKAHGCWMQAQAEATLALVEQQRIANLIAVTQMEGGPHMDINRWHRETHDADGCYDGDEDSLPYAHREIREGLGL